MSIERELLNEVLEYFDPLGLNTEHCGDLPERIKKLLAQPEQEQEPVAWHYIYDDGITVRERVTEYMPLGKYYTITPLYTAPPKRECINHDDILDRSNTGSFEYRDGFMDGVLYAENHHGIGGGE